MPNFSKFEVLLARRDDVEDEFHTLAARWEHETFGNSRVDELFAHPAYRAIVSLGDDVMPYLLQDLADHSFRWLYALQEITGAKPAEGAADVEIIAEAWKRGGGCKPNQRCSTVPATGLLP